MILLYRVLSYILYPFLFIFLYFRVIAKKEDPKRYKEKIFVKYFNVTVTKNSKLLWFHAASIGELKSIAPIVKELSKKKDHYEFLITTVTFTSGQLAATIFKEYSNIYHRFLPFDVNFLINKFLNGWRPEKIFLVDSEIWPNLIFQAKKNKIPIALINARITKKTYKRWILISKTAKNVFSLFDLCLCANQETKNFLEVLGANNIKYYGNIKLIKENDEKIFNSKNERILSTSKLWVAASTHKEEDYFCLNTHVVLKKKYNDLITIIAPRHINRVHEINFLSRKFKLKTQILNHNDEITKGVEIIIINSFGLLQNYFKHAKSVFIGKSIVERLKNDSGQNPIDAAYLNCKIYHGPYVSNFEEIYKILKINNISKQVRDYNELCKHLIVDLNENLKKNINISKSIEIMGKNVFSDTINTIEKFLNDKNY
tara:strand:- start:1219 stop:2502 length:1284 start_codon:yes stop_codon:yes gene_type:complete